MDELTSPRQTAAFSVRPEGEYISPETESSKLAVSARILLYHPLKKNNKLCPQKASHSALSPLSFTYFPFTFQLWVTLLLTYGQSL